MVSIPATFKAYVYEKWGPIEEVLKLVDVEAAPLPASHVRIQVHSVGLNPADYKLAEANRLIFTTQPPSKEQPYNVGFDLAGVVVEVGSEAGASRKLQVGDEVYAMASFEALGTLAEFVSMKAEYVMPKPTTLDFDAAAGVPSVALTSYQAITNHAKLKANERIMVLGGSSATGIFAVQYAKSLGAYVIATTSTKNVAFVEALGADEVIDYTSQTWVEVVERHSLDVVYDCGVEPRSWENDAQLALKKDTGRFVTLTPGMMPSEPKFGAAYADVFVRASEADLEDVTKLIDTGKVKVFIDSVFPMDKAREAFTRVKTGRAVGKVIIRVL